MILIVMGVTGSGKTTIGKLLANRMGAVFADADGYHPPRNLAKLASGTPLTDEDRQPWLERLNGLLLQWQEQQTGGVLACSALKDAYRATLTRGLPEGAARFVLLEGSRALIAERLAHRREHFMNPALLDSQFATLEDPGGDALRVSNDGTPDQTVDAVLSQLRVNPAVTTFGDITKGVQDAAEPSKGVAAGLETHEEVPGRSAPEE